MRRGRTDDPKTSALISRIRGFVPPPSRWVVGVFLFDIVLLAKAHLLGYDMIDRKTKTRCLC